MNLEPQTRRRGRSRDILVVISSSLWTAVGREARRAARSRRLLRLGQAGRALYRGSPRGERVAVGCYHRAWRELESDQAEPAPVTAAALEAALRARLGAGIFRAWLPTSRRRAGAAAGLAAALAVLLIAATPPVRRALFVRDLAAGKPWVASSAWSDFPKEGTMADPGRPDALFHTNEEQSPSVTVDLGTVRAIHEVTIDNRVDCCRERALPLVVEVSMDGTRFGRVAYRRILFDSFTASFPRVRARFVRVRVDRLSVLHLRRVRVY